MNHSRKRQLVDIDPTILESYPRGDRDYTFVAGFNATGQHDNRVGHTDDLPPDITSAPVGPLDEILQLPYAGDIDDYPEPTSSPHTTHLHTSTWMVTDDSDSSDLPKFSAALPDGAT